MNIAILILLAVIREIISQSNFNLSDQGQNSYCGKVYLELLKLKLHGVLSLQGQCEQEE